MPTESSKFKRLFRWFFSEKIFLVLFWDFFPVEIAIRIRERMDYVIKAITKSILKMKNLPRWLVPLLRDWSFLLSRTQVQFSFFNYGIDFHIYKKSVQWKAFSKKLILIFTVINCIMLIYHYVVRCIIWYHLYNLKNVKNTRGGMLLLVKLQAKV